MSAFDTLKSQMMTIMAIKHNETNMYSMIYSFVLIAIFEHIFGWMPAISKFIETHASKYFEKTKRDVEHKLGQNLSVEEKEYTIHYIRSFKNVGTSMNTSNPSSVQLEYECCDCLIEKMTQSEEACSLEFNKIYYVNHKNKFQIDKDIFVQIKKIIFTQENDLSTMDFVLSSKKYNLQQLHEYVDDVVKQNRIKKQNKLGDQLYYFDEIVKPIPKDNYGKPLYRMAPETLSFMHTKFFANKTIDNVFGPEILLVKNRLNMFINNPEWYTKKGIPYTFGLLIHGEPGCGKTSMCKVISNMTKRHIISIKLSDHTTKRQLHNLFFDERIIIEKPGNVQEQLIIPINKRVFLIEDIDCMTDIVLDRNSIMNKDIIHVKEEMHDDGITSFMNTNNSDDDCEYSTTIGGLQDQLSLERMKNENIKSLDTRIYTKKETNKKKEEQKKEEQIKKKEDNLDDKLTLSYLLNLLDGVLETPGRVLIMTTNYKQNLDKALIRPGRIDLDIDFKLCTNETIKEMIYHFYDTLEKDYLDNIQFMDNMYTPAEIYQIMFNNMNKPEETINKLKIK